MLLNILKPLVELNFNENSKYTAIFKNVPLSDIIFTFIEYIRIWRTPDILSFIWTEWISALVA